MSEPDNKLMFEVLKQVQEGNAQLRDDIAKFRLEEADATQQVQSSIGQLRKLLLDAVHGANANERRLGDLERRIRTIEQRLLV